LDNNDGSAEGVFFKEVNDSLNKEGKGRGMDICVTNMITVPNAYFDEEIPEKMYGALILYGSCKYGDGKVKNFLMNAGYAIDLISLNKKEIKDYAARSAKKLIGKLLIAVGEDNGHSG
jgi:hypothetical protein